MNVEVLLAVGYVLTLLASAFGLGLMILVIVGVRHHESTELAVLTPATGISLLAGWWLAKDLLAHPANFPEPKPAHGLKFETNEGATSES